MNKFNFKYNLGSVATACHTMCNDDFMGRLLFNEGGFF